MANFLYGTPGDTLVDVGDFSFTGSTPAVQEPVISGWAIADGKLTIRATGGAASVTCALVGSSDLKRPASAWTSAGTGVFDARGECAWTLPLDPADPVRFFRLRVP